MLTTIPAMDLMDGHCVRLRQGNFSSRTDYSSDPLDIARKFEDAGFRRLHMVDLDGARSGAPRHFHILEKIAGQTGLEIDFSGGVKTDEEMASVFSAGAAFAAIGSVAVKNRPLFLKWLRQFDPDRILLGVDVRDEKIAVAGWTEQTDIDLFEFLSDMTGLGVKKVFCTDIGRDGLMTGPAVALYRKILDHFPGLELIASGGVCHPDDLRTLEEAGCAGVIVGKAIYEDLSQLGRWLK